MTVKSKDEIVSQLGKYGILEAADKRLLNKVGYLGGVPAFDEKLANKKRGEYLLNFEIRPKGLEIKVDYVFTSTRIGLFPEQIDFFVIEPQKQIVEKKGKSIVGRALVGGILLGPVGAIVGGMTGIGNKDVRVTQVDNILSIKLNDPDTILTFSVDNKYYNDVESYLQKFFKEKYKHPEEFETSQPTEKAVSVSVADELMKLKSLVDQGILTEQEFQTQKQKLLNT
jgi:Short C-terminal domain